MSKQEPETKSLKLKKSKKEPNPLSVKKPKVASTPTTVRSSRKRVRKLNPASIAEN